MSERLLYWRARMEARRVPVTYFPEGGAYVCSFCDRTFEDHYARNVHEWQAHPGCPKYQIRNFDQWVASPDAAFHSCRCRPEACERGCSIELKNGASRQTNTRRIQP